MDLSRVALGLALVAMAWWFRRIDRGEERTVRWYRRSSLGLQAAAWPFWLVLGLAFVVTGVVD